MSKNSNFTGKTIVADRVIEIAGSNSSDLDILGLQLNSQSQKYTEAQNQFAREYSISIVGPVEVAKGKPTTLTAYIYHNGRRLTVADRQLKESSITWRSTSSKFEAQVGSYSSKASITVSIDDLESSATTFSCIWKSEDNDSVPIFTTFQITLGRYIQYGKTTYSRESDVLTNANLIYWTTNRPTSVAEGEYVWYRASSDYSFSIQSYRNWEYFKLTSYFDSTDFEGTEQEWIESQIPEVNMFDFTLDIQQYTIDYKHPTENTKVKATAYVVGYDLSKVTWDYPEEVTLTGEYPDLEFSIPYDYDEDRIDITMVYDNGEPNVTKTLLGVDRTEYGAFLGNIPSPPSGVVTLEGDYFLANGESKDYAENVPYVKLANGNWDELEGTDIDKALVVLGSALGNEKDLPSGKFLYLLVKNLIAKNASIDELVSNEAFLKRLKTYDLRVGEGTEQSGFYMRIQDGNPPKIIILYNGEELWKVDATNGKMYGNFAEVLQYLPFNFDDSLDKDHPFECEFYIPSSAKIQSIKLSAKGQNYRAYSKSMAIMDNIWNYNSKDQIWTQGSGTTGASSPDLSVTKTSFANQISTGTESSHTHSYDKIDSSSGSHQHAINASYYQYSDKTQTGVAGEYYGSSLPAHAHDVSLYGLVKEVSATQNDGAHTHGTTSATSGSGSAHSHLLPDGIVTDVSGGAHTHSFNISHKHDLEFGIYEGTSPSGVYLFIDNGQGYPTQGISLGSNATLAQDVELKNYISGTGWKRMKFTSTRLGRITVQLIAELLVTK